MLTQKTIKFKTVNYRALNSKLYSKIVKMSELFKTVESFVDDFMSTDLVCDEELISYRDHGWVCDVKNFNVIFEEMAKASNRLHQNGEDAIQTLEVRFNRSFRSTKV